MPTKPRVEYDDYHGSPYDRGGADAYYRRPIDPHIWPDGTYSGTRTEMKDMTREELEAYYQGFNDTIDAGHFKDWGVE